jgi:hypothetical protein
MAQHKDKCECSKRAGTKFGPLILSNYEVEMAICEWLYWNFETCPRMEQMHQRA